MATIDSKNLLVWVKAMSRGQALPLDASEVHDSFAAAETYAASATAYAGQTIKALMDDGKYHEYIIQPTASGFTLEEVGAIKESDLKQYVQVVEALPESGQEEGVLYIADTTGSIWTGSAWKEVFHDVTADIEALEEAIGDETKGLTKAVADNKAAIDAEKAAREAADKTNADAIAAVDAKFGTLTEGKTVAEMIADAQSAATYDDTALSGRVKTIEDDYLKKADKDELAGNIKTNADAIAAVKEDVDTFFKDADLTESAKDTLKEIQEYMNSDAGAAAEMTASIQKNAQDIKAISDDYLQSSDKTELQGNIDALSEIVEGKADAEHGVHVTYSDAAPEMDGEASAGVSEAVARADHKHPVDTSRASKSEFDTHVGDAVAHLTEAEHVKLTGIEEGAEVNVIDSVDENEFIIEDRKLSILQIAMNKITGLVEALAGKADKATTLAGYGITDAYNKTEIDGSLQTITDNLNTKISAADVDTKIAEAKEETLEEAATASDAALEARIGAIPEDTTIQSYIDTAIGSGGTASAQAIAQAKQEAINTSNTYTDTQIAEALTITEF